MIFCIAISGAGRLGDFHLALDEKEGGISFDLRRYMRQENSCHRLFGCVLDAYVMQWRFDVMRWRPYIFT